jgi:hypothetical protein
MSKNIRTSMFVENKKLSLATWFFRTHPTGWNEAERGSLLTVGYRS